MSEASLRLAFEHPRRPWPPNAGLGTIAYGANGDMKRATDTKWMWKKYDEKFGDRFDYQLWRRVARPLFLSDISSNWGTPREIANRGLVAKDPKHIWGLLAVLAGCFARRANLTKWQELAAARPKRVNCTASAVGMPSKHSLRRLLAPR